MFGQAKSFEFDPLQEAVDRYVEENSPYGPFVPMRINVRKYLQYVEEHSITDPTTIPDEILDSFMVPEKPQSIAQ